MIEAHISGGSSIGIDLGYTADTNNKEIAVSLGAGDFKYKKEDDGFKVDASAGLAGGATIKGNYFINIYKTNYPKKKIYICSV